MKTQRSNNKKQPQIDFEQDDQFQLSPDHQQHHQQNKIKDKKSIANIYSELLNKKKAQQQNPEHQQKELSKKQKKRAKQKIKKQQVKQQTIAKKQKKQAQKIKEKTSSSLKYINNKALEDQLRKSTLKGVAKIFNLIAAHKKEMQA